MELKIVLVFFLIVCLLTGCTLTPFNPITPAESAQISLDTKETEAEPSAVAKESQYQETSNPWQDLPFDQFLEESWNSIMRRDPEALTELGLSQAFGIRDDTLTNISDAYVRQTYALYAQIQDALVHYDQKSLTSDQKLSYDIYAWYLDDVLRGEEFICYEYPITHFITGVQYQVINFFTDIHPVTNLQNAQDYITRLSQVDTKFEQVIGNMKLSEQAGVITPRFILQWSLGDIRNIARSPAKSTTFYTSFAEKVYALDDLSAEQKSTLLDAAVSEIETSVIPGFQALTLYLEDLHDLAPTDDGVWQYPRGDEYYAFRVRRYTTTDLTPEEIHQKGLEDLEVIKNEMRVILDQLGYPTDESLPELYARVSEDGGTLYGEEIVAGYEAIIEEAKVRAAEVLDLQPRADVVVIPGPSGGYNIGPAVDGSRPGAFYAAVSGSEPRFRMASLAYHETVPGHHTQIALALEKDLPSFRRGSLFNAYVEGWALYAERLMAEIGAYTDDAYGDLGRLQYEAFRSARLVVDTGIHNQGWTFDEAVEFMVANTGMERGQMEFEVARYIAWPAQALAYKIGMDEILRLRARAEAQLGDRFNLRQFHNVVIGNGAVPLLILEQIVDDYIASN